MKIFLRLFALMFTLSFLSQSAEAQSMQWAWSRSYGAGGDESVSKIAANSAGYVFAFGTFKSSPLQVGPTTLTNVGDSDLFLITHDTLGNLQWARSFGSIGNDTPGDMSTDGDGNVIISGTFVNSITIGSNVFTSFGSTDIFIAKLDRFGTLLWAKQVGGAGVDVAYALKCDAANNIYISGTYSNSPVAIGSTVLTSGGTYNVFYGQLDASGNPVWVKKTSSEAGFALDKIDLSGNDRVMFFGHSSGQPFLNFNTSGPSIELSSRRSPFYVKTDLSGNIYAQKSDFPMGTFSSGTGALVAPNKQLYYSGQYGNLQSTIPIGFMSRRDSNDLIISDKFLLTSPRTITTYPYSIVTDIALAKGQRLFSVGAIGGSADFSDGFTVTAPSVDGYSIFVWETDTALTTKHLLSSSFGSSATGQLSSVSIDTLTNSLYAGGYTGISGLILGPDILNSNGNNDILISKVSINGYDPAVPPFMEAGKDTFLCSGSSVNIGDPAGAVWGVPPYNYSWSPATGLADANSPFTLATPASSTTYVLTVADAASHIFRDTIHISVGTVPPAPTITASGPTTFCSPGNLTLTSSPAAGNYVWSNGATTQAIPVVNSGTYSVKDSIAPGCVSLVSLPVIVTANPGSAAPAITVTGTLPFCAGSGNSVTLTSSPAGPGETYLWTNGATTQSITVNETDGSGSFKVLILNGSCHSDWSNVVAVYSMAAPPPLTISPGGPVTFCQGGSVILNASAGHFYRWSNGATTQSITVNSSGTYYVQDSTGTGVLSTCWSNPTSVTVTVNPVPATPTITSGPLNFCEGSFTTLTANGDGTGYLWSNGATTQAIIVTSTGSYTVKTTTPGCNSLSSLPVATTSVPVPSTPIITASGPLAVCNGSSIILTSSAGHNYLWSTGASTQGITVNTAGNYSVRDSVPGCASAASSPVVVTFTALPATPTITAGGPLTFCSGGTVTLTSSTGSSYLWSTGATTQAINVVSNSTVHVNVSTAGCSSLPSANATVIVNPLPSVPVITQSGNILTSSAASGNQWYYNGSSISGATANQYNYTLPGDYSVTVTDANGCSASSEDLSASFANGTVTTLRNGEPFLHFVSPNPAQANSYINFNLRSASTMSIAIMGETGFKVAELVKSQSMAAGDHRIALGNNFYKLKSGLYIITYIINGEKISEKIVAVK